MDLKPLNASEVGKVPNKAYERSIHAEHRDFIVTNDIKYQAISKSDAQNSLKGI